ncbi:MAG TPA: hypothetical protein VGM10_16505 [Actinocrinis sp.]|jgi:hypothetical protein
MRTLKKRHRPAALGVSLALAVSAMVALSTPASAATSRFVYGTDSFGPTPGGSAPYKNPSCSGHYGVYFGKIGGADLVSSGNPDGYGPGVSGAWDTKAANDANTDHYTYKDGVGDGAFWYMFGPNARPHMTPYNWGVQQAKWALADWARLTAKGAHRVPLKILWADVEQPGANDWSTTNTAANRQVYNGFAATVASTKTDTLGLQIGVYSTNFQWGKIMAGHASLPGVWEWTAQTSLESQPKACPAGFSGGGISADFFGGQTATSAKTLAWQWSIGSGDYDSLDMSKNPPVS